MTLASFSPVGQGTVSSIFEEITRVVVQEVDVGGDMIAVRRILDADRFHRCSLVRGKRNFWGHQYHGPDLTLEDVLERREGEGPFDVLGLGPKVSMRG